MISLKNKFALFLGLKIELYKFKPVLDNKKKNCTFMRVPDKSGIFQ